MFNMQGSEMIFLLLIALVVLGPEKLPDAVRKFAKAYAEFKKMATGFQGELRQVLDEPMREMRDTANAVRDAATFDVSGTKPRVDTTTTTTTTSTTQASAASSEIAPAQTPATRAEQGLNFGSANPRRVERAARAENATAEATPTIDETGDPASAASSSPEPSADEEAAE